MFNVFYDLTTGEIKSYQEGALPNPEDIKEPNVGITSFASVVPGFIDQNGRTMMKVDIDTGRLVLLNPIQIPDPIPNPPNAAPQG